MLLTVEPADSLLAFAALSNVLEDAALLSAEALLEAVLSVPLVTVLAPASTSLLVAAGVLSVPDTWEDAGVLDVFSSLPALA